MARGAMLVRQGVRPAMVRGIEMARMLVMAAAVLTTAAAGEPPPRPHIVTLLTDNMGWANVGFHRPPDVPAREIHTPNVDQLAHR